MGMCASPEGWIRDTAEGEETQAQNIAANAAVSHHASILPHMAILSVLYPKSEQSTFDHSYYVEKHIPFVKSLLTEHGLQRIDLLRGVAATDGGAPAFELIGNIYFATKEQIGPALQAHGAEIIADIPNFTNIVAVVQISSEVAN
jgi:uncharacterized protein (TIGR02118 family)